MCAAVPACACECACVCVCIRDDIFKGFFDRCVGGVGIIMWSDNVGLQKLYKITIKEHIGQTSQ